MHNIEVATNERIEEEQRVKKKKLKIRKMLNTKEL